MFQLKILLNLINLFSLFLLITTQYADPPENPLNNLDNLINLNLIKKLVNTINKNTGGLWKAEVTPLSLLTFEQQKQLCGARIPNISNETEAEPPKFEETNTNNVKASCTTNIEFDSRKKWPKCASIISKIQEQGQCGSCWSVSTAAAYSDRYCIERSKKGLNTAANDASFQFSALDLMSCANNNKDGCLGGDPYNAWQWIKNHGICTGTDFKWKNGCKPYPFDASKITRHSPPCKSSCTGNWKIPYLNDKHKGISARQLSGSSSSVAAIQNEIKNNGPVVGAFQVYSDFYSYRSGVYFKTPNVKKLDPHAVRIIGWGSQTCNGNKVDFWLCANSWGSGFGENGLFKIRKGVNECGIEKMEISFGIPKV